MVISINLVIHTDFIQDPLYKYAVDTLYKQLQKYQDLFTVVINSPTYNIQTDNLVSLGIFTEVSQCTGKYIKPDWIYLLFKPTSNEVKLLKRNLPHSKFISCFNGIPNLTSEKLQWGIDPPKDEDIINNYQKNLVILYDNLNKPDIPSTFNIVKSDNTEIIGRTGYNKCYIMVPILDKSILNLYINWAVSESIVPVVEDLETVCDIQRSLCITCENLGDIGNNMWNITEDYHWETIICELHRLLGGQSKCIENNLVFFPLLDVNIPNIADSEDDSEQDNESNSESQISAYNSNGIIRQFYPWALTLSFRDIEKGIYIPKSELIRYNIDVKPRIGYITVGLMTFGDFSPEDNKKMVSPTLYHNNLPIFDSHGNNYFGCPPPHLWSHSSERHIYLRNPKPILENAFVTYLESPDSLCVLKNTINNLQYYNKDNDFSFHIYVYYRGDSTILQYPDILSEIDNTDVVILRNLNDYSKISFSPNNSITEQLLSIYLTEANQIIYFDPLVLWLDFPRKMFEDQSLCCFESTRRKNQETHYEVVSWIQKNLQCLPTYRPTKISGSVVKINREKHWLTLSVALGILRLPISKHISIGDILYLSQEALRYPSDVVMTGGDISELWLGRNTEGLFIGRPIYQMDDCVFYKVPIWYTQTPPLSQIKVDKHSSWYFEERLGSLVTSDKGACKLNKLHSVVERVNKMYL